MKNRYKKIIFYTLLVILWVSCGPKYDDLNTVTPTTAEPIRKPWQTHPSVLFENFSCKAAYADSSKMYVVGHSYFMEFDSTHRLVRKIQYRPDSSRPYYNNLPFINERFFAYWEWRNDSIFIYRTDNLAIKYGFTLHNLPFSNLHDLCSSFGETPFCRVMGNKLLLFLQERKANSEYKNIIAVYQINDNPTALSVDYQYYIELGSGYSGVISNINIKNDEELYIGTDTSKLVNVRTRSVRLLSPFIAYPKIGKIKDSLYLLGRNQRRGLTVQVHANQQWKTYDFGEAGNSATFFDYFFTNNQCIALDNDAIALFNFAINGDSMKINYRGIDTYGTGAIRQVIRFKDRMYIVSENGLYYKPLSEWLVHL